MCNKASKASITEFLLSAKRLISTGNYDFVPRRKSLQSLSEHGMTVRDAKDIILSLTVSNYYKGPKDDFDVNRPGHIWEFKTLFNGVRFYIKLKITSENNIEILKCIGFHEDEYS